MTDISPAVRVFRADCRALPELPDASVDLVVTSPPYWQIKDYGADGQIGWGQSLHEYLYDLSRVWNECYRALKPGRRLCVNIGDQFARAAVYGRYKIIALHAEVIAQCEAIGLDYMGAIIWQKKTTMNTTGGAVIMGSFPYPPNGIVELDYEYILLFKKPGESPRPTLEAKAASVLTKDEWKEYFAGHWAFGGARQINHEAQFPDELPRRLIRMFSFHGETVLDPFLGSGTTAKVAVSLGRSAVGYEINPEFVPLIKEKLCKESLLFGDTSVSVEERTESETCLADVPLLYRPNVPDANPVRESKDIKTGTDTTYKVAEVLTETTLRLAVTAPQCATDTGLHVSLAGIKVLPQNADKVREYFRKFLVGKQVLLKIESTDTESSAPLPVYLQLTNKLFVNRKMIETGLAVADRDIKHKLYDKFISAETKHDIQ